MIVLILGGSGMLGHKLWQVISERFDTYVTLRRGFDSYDRYRLFDREHTVDYVSAENLDSIARAIAKVEPNVVINCIGIVKQAEAAKDPLDSIEVNALFPHRVAKICRQDGIRFIHISTDCVFSGRKGNYKEEDFSDAEDLYGRTKYIGEVTSEGSLTIRTSIIGRELDTANGLIEWFLAQEGQKVSGYRQAIFSGFTTSALAEIISWIISEHQDLYGVWHVASIPINKFDLLSLVKQVYGLNIEIDADDTVVCDRSLSSDRLRQATDFNPPSWHGMIEQMYRDSTPYSELRRNPC
ncbi:dTDP-4-dehydrorhamnose reductase family protein [Chloroflexota bacterium]